MKPTTCNAIKLPDAYSHIKQQLNAVGIQLQLTRKRVKNINFRLKPYLLCVSAPQYASDTDIVLALHKRLAWVISQHADMLIRRQQSSQPMNDASNQNSPKLFKLWGELQIQPTTETERLRQYRQALTDVMPSLFDKWQRIVGKHASEQRIRKMRTRWGSCNTRAKRVWLSVYLPEFPIECTEYVIVHELCHLHHANHSADFWAEVSRAMPDYRQWHDMLAGRGSVD